MRKEVRKFPPKFSEVQGCLAAQKEGVFIQDDCGLFTDGLIAKRKLRIIVLSNMKIALYLWIVVVTFLLLFSPPMSVRYTFADGCPWNSIAPLQENILAIGGGKQVQVDFPRLLACLLAMNFIPAVLLLKWDQVTAFSKRNKGKLITVAVVLALLCVAGIVSSIQEEKARQKQIADEKAKQEADAARAGLPPGFVLDKNQHGLFDDLIPKKKPAP